jgi:hypothetical protein
MWLDFENYRQDLKRVGIETNQQLSKALLSESGWFYFPSIKFKSRLTLTR